MLMLQTNAGEWATREIARCKESLHISSPFLNGGFVELCRGTSGVVEKCLLTRTDLLTFARGSSDLNAVIAMAALGFAVVSHPLIHAKVYVIDRRTALVTSANATHRGLWRGLEAGIATDDVKIVGTLSESVTSAFGLKRECTKWNRNSLAALRPLVSTIRDRLPEVDSQLSRNKSLEEVESIDVGTAEEVSGHLTGWKKLVWEAVLELNRAEFDVRAIYTACVARAKSKYPRQRDPQAGIRRELQALRNLGLIRFVDNKGRYRRMVGSA